MNENLSKLGSKLLASTRFPFYKTSILEIENQEPLIRFHSAIEMKKDLVLSHEETYLMLLGLTTEKLLETPDNGIVYTGDLAEYINAAIPVLQREVTDELSRKFVEADKQDS